MRQPRYLLYAVDGLGLGHVTRLLALARALRAAQPAAEILFLTASEASHIIYSEGFAALKVLSRSAATVGGLRRDSFLRLNQSLVWNAVLAFDPHCLIVDTFAAGSLHELLPLLRWPLRKVFVFRAQRAERAAEPLLQSTLQLYDLVLVPHATGTEQVPVPAGVSTVWTGPMLLRNPHEMLPPAAARQHLGLPAGGELGLLTLGGGGEPELAAAQAMVQAATPPGATIIEALGPLAPPEAHSSLRGIYPLMKYLPAFDFAVAAAGYNTTHELIAAGVPTVFWPFTRDVDDQQARARHFANGGLALSVGEGIATERPAELRHALEQLSDRAVRERLRATLTAHNLEYRNGAAVGAAAIVELMTQTGVAS